MTAAVQLRLRNISKTYPNGVRALDDVSLTIPTGMFGLLGPNGAGKSTLMRMIATLQDRDGGSIRLGELDVLRQKDEVRKTLGYLPSNRSRARCRTTWYSGWLPTDPCRHADRLAAPQAPADTLESIPLGRHTLNRRFARIDSRIFGRAAGQDTGLVQPARVGSLSNAELLPKASQSRSWLKIGWRLKARRSGRISSDARCRPGRSAFCNCLRWRQPSTFRSRGSICRSAAAPTLSPAAKQASADLAKTSEWLRACRDLANGSKHFTIDCYEPLVDHADAATGFGKGRFGAAAFGVGEWSITVSWDGTTYQALELVARVCEVWTAFFREYAPKDDGARHNIQMQLASAPLMRLRRKRARS